MSKYTTEVRYICEVESGLVESKGFNSIEEILTESAPKVFNFNFPIFDESYRLPLEVKILRHFYTREICEETVGLWKLRLSSKLNEIMPYYNKLYASELFEFNPLYDVDYTRQGGKEGVETGTESGTNGNNRTNTMGGTVTDENSGDSTKTNNLTSTSTDSGSDVESNESANKNDHWDYYSDTPQGTVDNLEDLSYLTNARHITDDGGGSTSETTTTYGKTNTARDTGTQNITNETENTRTYDTTNYITDSGTHSNTKRVADTQSYIEHVSGKMNPHKSYAQLVKEFRESLLNIDADIIAELEPLFFGLWD